MDKKKRYNTNVKPKDRDLIMMRDTGLSGVITLMQIHRRYFKGLKLETTKKRIGELVDGGYFHTAITTVKGNQERIYWIERKAGKCFPHAERGDLIRQKPQVSEIAGMVKANDILDKLNGRYNVKGWRSERKLKSENSLIKEPRKRKEKVADLEVTLESESGEEITIPIEIDSGDSGVRLKSNLSKLSRSYDRAIVVAFSLGRLARIKKEAESYPNLEVKLFEQLRV